MVPGKPLGQTGNQFDCSEEGGQVLQRLLGARLNASPGSLTEFTGKVTLTLTD